jgi:hypothetical protein
MNASHRACRFLVSMLAISMAAPLQSCSPRVGLEVPDKPVTINLNVKIDHEVRVKVDKELDKVISKDSDLF